MSDTLSITLRAIDKKYLLENPTPERRFQAVKEKTQLLDAERQQNPYLEEIISSPEQLRADFDAIRRKKYKGLLGKVTPRLYDESYNQNVSKIASIAENTTHLLTRQLREQYALLSLGATLIANGLVIAGTNYLNEESHIPTNIDPSKVLFYITATGLALGGTLQIITTNRNSYQMRPLNAIAYVQSNLTMYNLCAPKLRTASFDEAQKDGAIVQWQYYEQPQSRVLKTPADVHPDICNPKFKETTGTYFHVTFAQGARSVKNAVKQLNELLTVPKQQNNN